MSESPGNSKLDNEVISPPASERDVVSAGRGDTRGPSRSSSSTRTTHKYNITVNLTEADFTAIAARADAARLPRAHYVRNALLAYRFLRTTAPADLLPLTTAAIACVRVLARTTASSAHPATRLRLEASMAELTRIADQLERHATRLAAVLALTPAP